MKAELLRRTLKQKNRMCALMEAAFRTALRHHRQAFVYFGEINIRGTLVSPCHRIVQLQTTSGGPVVAEFQRS